MYTALYENERFLYYSTVHNDCPKRKIRRVHASSCCCRRPLVFFFFRPESKPISLGIRSVGGGKLELLYTDIFHAVKIFFRAIFHDRVIQVQVCVFLLLYVYTLGVQRVSRVAATAFVNATRLPHRPRPACAVGATKRPKYGVCLSGWMTASDSCVCSNAYRKPVYCILWYSRAAGFSVCASQFN